MAIDADGKVIPSFYIDARDANAAWHFIVNLALRLANRVPLTCDGHKPYPELVEQSFGVDIDYTMLTKHHGDTPGTGRYGPSGCTSLTSG